MSKESSGFRQKMTKLRKPHRFVVINDETHEQRRSFKLTALNLYLLISLTFLLLTALVVSLIFFTPLRKIVPGYGDIRKDQTYIELTDEVALLENRLMAQDTYLETLRARMTEDMEVLTSISTEVTAEVDPSETVEKIEQDAEMRKALERRRILQKQAGASQSAPVAKILVTPVVGNISRGYAPDQDHFGLDIIAPGNSPILAAADGIIFLSDWTESQGNCIGLLHIDETVTMYKHNSVLLKKVGSSVKAGEAIAIIGNSGELTDGPHLHFEIWIDGRPVDPELYLTF